MIGALLLAVSTYPPLLPRGVLVQVVESGVLWSLGGWLGRSRAPLGPVGAVVTAAWVAVTLGLQDVQSVDLGLDPVGWAPAVVLGTDRAARGPGRRRAGGGRARDPPGRRGSRSAHASLAGGGVAGVGRRTPPGTGPVHVDLALGPGAPADRAETAVRRLAAEGGLARRTLVVVVPTGSGWVDDVALDTLADATDGDVASVTVAYDDAPSWLSYLTARDEAVATTDALLAAVARHRPAGTHVVLYGQSLGALAGAQAWARHPERADGAFWVGPPADTPRDPAAVTLAHPTDPAAVWSPWLLVTPPERPVARPWLPVVSFVQTSVDLLGAVGAPAGSGHHYGAEQRAGWDRVLAR